MSSDCFECAWECDGWCMHDEGETVEDKDNCPFFEKKEAEINGVC